MSLGCQRQMFSLCINNSGTKVVLDVLYIPNMRQKLLSLDRCLRRVIHHCSNITNAPFFIPMLLNYYVSK